MSQRQTNMKDERTGGHVYVLNNNLNGSNSITIFNRAADGTLTLLDTIPIGGLGSRVAFADGSQGSLIITPEKTRLFAVDAGSDQISVIDVNEGQLSPRGIFPSGGVGPVSLTYKDGLLYVLNAAEESQTSANVAGFHIDADGTPHPISGATKLLSAPHPHPVQVQIDPLGQFLLVTEQGTDCIDVYHIQSDGNLSDSTIFPSVGAAPFGMAFNLTSSLQELIVADAEGAPDGTGAVTTYRLVDGDIRLIHGPVPDYQMDPCWMVITSDGHFAYTSNAHSQSISGFRIMKDGTLSLLNANGISGTTPLDTFPIEEALSSNGRFLYVLDSRALLTPPGPATLSGFLIGPDGSLISVIDSARINLPFSAIGLVAD